MAGKTQITGIVAAVAMVLSIAVAHAGGAFKVILKADKAGKGSIGEAVVKDKAPGRKEVTIDMVGLKPGAVYTVWLVNTTPKMDMIGVGTGDFSVKSDAKGNAHYSATIAEGELNKWEFLEIAWHPSGDPKNAQEMGNIALKGKLRK